MILYEILFLKILSVTEHKWQIPWLLKSRIITGLTVLQIQLQSLNKRQIFQSSMTSFFAKCMQFV